MNLLIYSPQMSPYGGLERHVCLVAEAISASGSSVTLVTTSNSLSAAWRQRLIVSGIYLIEQSVSTGRASGLSKVTWLLFQCAKLRAKHWDIIYTNGQGRLTGLVWLLAGPGTRRIHHHHTSADKSEQRTWSKWFLLALKNASELIGCSRFTASQLDAATKRSDSRFLPYLTETAIDFNCSPSRTAAQPLHFGFFGRLVSTKGIEVIVKLSEDSRCGHIQWHIHGSGVDYPQSYFENHAGVIYHGGYDTPQDQAVALNNLDAVVLLSIHSEGMPLSIIESMAAGLPWVASARGGITELSELCPDSELVDSPEDYEQCLSAVLRLSSRILNGMTSRTAQRKFWQSTFSPEVVSAQWIEYLDNSPAVSS